MNRYGCDVIALGPEVARPWKYIPDFPDDEYRWLRAESTSQVPEEKKEEKEVEDAAEERRRRTDEGQGLLQYHRQNRALEVDDPKGDLELEGQVKVIGGGGGSPATSTDDVHDEVEVEPIVPVEVEEYRWKTPDAPDIVTCPEEGSIDPQMAGEEATIAMAPFPPADAVQVGSGLGDLAVRNEGHVDDRLDFERHGESDFSPEESGSGREESDPDEIAEVHVESRCSGIIPETAIDPGPEASDPVATEAVEEVPVEIKAVEISPGSPPVANGNGEGFESGTGEAAAILAEPEVDAQSSGTSGEALSAHGSVIERREILDARGIAAGEEVGGTLPRPGTKTIPPEEKSERPRRTKSETFFGFVRRKTKSKEREAGGGGGEGGGGEGGGGEGGGGGKGGGGGEEEEKNGKEPGTRRTRRDSGHAEEGGQDQSAATTSTTTPSEEPGSEAEAGGTPHPHPHPSKSSSFFQKLGLGKPGRKTEKQQQHADDQTKGGVVCSQPKGVPAKTARQSSAPKSNAADVTTTTAMDVSLVTRGTEPGSDSHQTGLGQDVDSPPPVVPGGGSDGSETSRGALYDGKRAAGSKGDPGGSDGSRTAVETESALSAIFEKRNFIVAAAIDFGTAFSGYAFCFLRDPEKIHMMGRWEDGDPGLINQKAPTTLLLTPNGRFHSFGFTARNNYHDLTEEDAKEWLYFDRFKMALYESKDFSESMTIEAANGKRFSGVEAISLALRFFADHALQQISSQSETRIVNDDVLWIVTVPAIWNPSAKQLMRLAAYKAGLASSDRPDQLQIALEPEAASVHIRRLQLRHLVPERPVLRPLTVRGERVDPKELEYVVSQFSHVVRYMVVDSGGGTVDITVHEMNFMSRRLQELHAATGGPHGSTAIDRDFERLLESIFGSAFVQSYRRERPSGWIGLMMAFESRKRAADPRKTTMTLNVSLPFSFIEFHRKFTGKTVEEALKAYGDSGASWSSQGMLRLTQDTMKKLFSRTLDKIREAIDNVLVAVKGIDYIFLVGGLSESSVFQCFIREHFNDKVRKVVIPQEANLAVIKGALAFGLDPTIIAIRRSPLTYGAAVLNRFVPGRHPESKLVSRDGVQWAKDVFDVFVAAGQVVRAGETVVRQYIPAAPGQKRIVIDVYCSTEGRPEYITDRGVRKCADLSLDLTTTDGASGSGPTSGSGSTSGSGLTPQRRIQAELVFAETEIRVTATDTTTGRKVNASIDFLNV